VLGSLETLTHFVRFQLDQLSAESGHHKFERLSFELARKRVCSNLLPPTGPVSAGGDQGRDAESIRTHLTKEGLARTAFVGLASDRNIVIACTLTQKGRVKAKIKKDVQVITGSGRPVTDIHYFCASDIPVASRHKLEAWARAEHDVELHIRDGQAISRDLADPDCFFIAMEYLSVPGDMYPQLVPDNTERWYRDSLAHWKNYQDKPRTFAMFSDLRSATHHATFEEDLQKDLPFWRERLEQFLAEGVNPVLRRRAVYEIAVASIRGLGTLDGQENRLSLYFSEVTGDGSLSDLRDASILVNYCLGAIVLHGIQLDEDEVLGWHADLTRELEQRLDATDRPGQRCEILHTLGYLRLRGDVSGDPTLPSGIETWLQLCDEVDHAPLFPLERFADFLTNSIELIGPHPKYDALARRVDELLATRVGRLVATEKCRDRAVAFHNQGQILRAISELHTIKVNWFADETLRGSVLSMLFIAGCYSDLVLFVAAKYYSLAAAWVGVDSEKPGVRRLVSRALFQAAEIDYRVGNWCGWLRLADLAIKSHAEFDPNPGDFDANPELERILFYAALVLAITQQISTPLAIEVQDVVSNWGLDDLIRDPLRAGREDWSNQDAAVIQADLEDRLGVRAYMDLADQREIVWHELGLLWRVRWRNDFQTTVGAEQLAAALQVAVTDFANIDLLLLKTEIDIFVSIDDIDTLSVEPNHTNEDRRWRVVLPRHQSGPKGDLDWQSATLAGVAIHLLRDVSLLPHSEFMAALEQVVKNGLMANVFVARPYGELYRDIYSEEALIRDLEIPVELRNQRLARFPTPHPEVSWINGPAPKYSERDSLEAIMNRYEGILTKLPVTIVRLSQCTEFQQTVAELRGEGWRDWHILLAVASIVGNIRMRLTLAPPELSAEAPDQNVLKKFTQQFIETMGDLNLESSAPVDLGEFTIDNLREHLGITMGATLKGLGLELHQDVPDLPAISEFLSRRYNYWTDDIEHPDPFCPAEKTLWIPDSAHVGSG
jgi:hypothetical protein